MDYDLEYGFRVRPSFAFHGGLKWIISAAVDFVRQWVPS